MMEDLQNNIMKFWNDEGFNVENIQNDNSKFIIGALQKHLSLLSQFLEQSSINSRKEFIHFMLSRFFVDKVSSLQINRFECQMEDNSNWGFEILPSECFKNGGLSVIFRRELFYKILKPGEVLECNVRGITQDFYFLLVVNKYGSARVIHDLNITAQLPRTETEESLLKSVLKEDEFLRVAVSNTEKDGENVTITGTLDEHAVQYSEKYIRLGRINPAELPLYVRAPNSLHQFDDLASYLRSNEKFQKPSTYSHIFKDFGLDPKKIYSFHTTFPSLKEGEPTGQELLKAAKAQDLKNYLSLAETEINNKCPQKAFEAIEEALILDKDCVKAYELRACLNAELESDKVSTKAMLDFEKVFTIDSENIPAKNYSSTCFLKAAVQFCVKDDFANAAKYVELALQYNKDNVKAHNFQIRLKKAHPECFVDEIVEEQSLNGLVLKKEELVSKLNEISDTT